jgi:hypothetical protein
VNRPRQPGPLRSFRHSSLCAIHHPLPLSPLSATLTRNCSPAQFCSILSPLFATLTDTLSRKSFPCHSYENTRGGIPVSARRFSISSFDRHLSTVSLFLPFSAPQRLCAIKRPVLTAATAHKPDKTASVTSPANPFLSIACAHFPSPIGCGGSRLRHLFKCYFNLSSSRLTASLCHTEMSVMSEAREGVRAHVAALRANSARRMPISRVRDGRENEKKQCSQMFPGLRKDLR